MNITLIAVGKTSSAEIENIVSDYHKRIKRCAVSIKIIPNLKKKYLDTNRQKLEEGRAILKAINSEDFVALLDDKGKSFTSMEFASWVEHRMMLGKNVVFVIGGAYGFSQELYHRADLSISLSKMTFSHQIIRAIFMEQLYRAFSIIDGLPYHNE